MCIQGQINSFLGGSYNDFSMRLKKCDEQLLYTVENTELSIGLGCGKMGICIYLFFLSEIYNENHYKQRAKRLLDNIIKNVTVASPLDINDGLLGIGFGINYLIETKNIYGNINNMLADVDDHLFKQIAYPELVEGIFIDSLIEYILYLNMRVPKQKGENRFIFESLIGKSLNILQNKVDYSLFDEPSNFSFNYQLPKFIYMLSNLYSNGFFRAKCINILKELSPKIISSIPVLHSNKLLLLNAINSLNKCIDIELFKNYFKTLFDMFNPEYMINEEFRDRNIFFYNGLSGAFYLINKLAPFFTHTQVISMKDSIMRRIISSSVWLSMEDPSFFCSKSGLLNGFCGTSILIYKYFNNNEDHS